MTANHDDLSCRISHFIQGRDSCFVIIPYQPEKASVYAAIKEIVGNSEAIGLNCTTASEEPGAGYPLLPKIHEMILRADVVIADLSEPKPNVFYEYGFAKAHHRETVVIIERGKAPEIPTDLRELEVLEYDLPIDRDTEFREKLIETVRKRITSPVPELRKALAAPKPFPAYILAAPRVPDKNSRHPWHPPERFAFGDNFGVTAILASFGNLFGIRRLPHLIHADYAEQVWNADANFYLIGSSKVNTGTRHFLPLIQQGWESQWSFRPADDFNDPQMRIFLGEEEVPLSTIPVDHRGGGDYEDCGLVIRTKHPNSEDRMVTILAGRHSIGTHAACMVMTEPDLIRKLDKELMAAVSDRRESVLAEKTLSFWALVKGRIRGDRNEKEEPMAVKDVEIVKVASVGQT